MNEQAICGCGATRWNGRAHESGCAVNYAALRDERPCSRCGLPVPAPFRAHNDNLGGCPEIAECAHCGLGQSEHAPGSGCVTGYVRTLEERRARLEHLRVLFVDPE